RLHRRIPPLLLRLLHPTHRPRRKRQHAAQLLVLGRAHHPPARRRRQHRRRSCPPHITPSRRTPRQNSAGARRLLPRDRPLDHRQHLRRRQRRCDLPPRHLLRRNARPTRRGQQRHRRRRRHSRLQPPLRPRRPLLRGRHHPHLPLRRRHPVALRSRNRRRPTPDPDR